MSTHYGGCDHCDVGTGCTEACAARPECTVCGAFKQPRGRSAPMGSYGCTWECEGYNQEPHVGHLWPKEWREHAAGHPEEAEENEADSPLVRRLQAGIAIPPHANPQVFNREVIVAESKADEYSRLITDFREALKVTGIAEITATEDAGNRVTDFLNENHDLIIAALQEYAINHSDTIRGKRRCDGISAKGSRCVQSACRQFECGHANCGMHTSRDGRGNFACKCGGAYVGDIP